MARANRSQRGSALILALGFMVVVLVIAAGVHGYVTGQLRASGAQGRRVAADYLARGAVARAFGWFGAQNYQLPDVRTLRAAVPAVLRIGNQPVVLPTQHPDSYTDALGKTRTGVLRSYQSFLTAQTTSVGTYSVTASLMNIMPEIWDVVATAQVGEVRRQAGAILHRRRDSLFPGALFGRDRVHIGGSAVVDSYDSSAGPYGGTNLASDGDVSSNGSIDVGGSAIVKGDAMPGPSGSVAIGGSAQITGLTDPATSARQLPAVTLPDNLINQGAITLNGTQVLTLATGNYLVSSINITANAKLVVDAAGGPVNLYVTGAVSIGGQGIVNTSAIASNLFLSMTGNQDFKLTGNADFYGSVYAPDSNLFLSGGGQMFGGFVGASVDNLNGNGHFHYDQALNSIPGPPGPLRMVSRW